MGELVDLASARAKRQPESWVSKQEIADHYGVVPRTIDRWREDGMPCSKMYANSPVRFRISECDRWFEGRAA